MRMALLLLAFLLTNAAAAACPKLDLGDAQKLLEAELETYGDTIEGYVVDKKLLVDSLQFFDNQYISYIDNIEEMDHGESYDDDHYQAGVGAYVSCDGSIEVIVFIDHD